MDAIKNRTLCIYAAYAKNKEYQDNVGWFVDNGGILPHVDYVFVVHDGGLPLNIPTHLPNVRIMNRPNQGLDFGAWSHAISTIEDDAKCPLSSLYTHYIFINSSVRGPVGNIAKGCDWTKAFTSLLTNDVLLSGLTINVLPIRALKGSIQMADAYGIASWTVLPHVQSMLFATNIKGLGILRKNHIFDPVPPYATMNEVIMGREVRMSIVLLAAGWNITCLASKYRGLDYRGGSVRQDPNPTSRMGDSFYPGGYWGSTVDINELMFYKTARLGIQTEY